ncbi:hypothetical protein [Nocardioides speluncae]|uniref:hypothetical protein n=1 Tax=Nocardioides speluncae TaxID=2670337 RepID=UPI0012B17C43|nr:hypothetical protein [Nocardioides speluncae]
MAGLSLLLVLGVAAVSSWLVLRDDGGSKDQDPGRPRPTTQADRMDSSAELLGDLQQAVTDRDKQAAAALAADGDAAAADRLTAIVDNARALEVRDFTLRYVDEDEAAGSEGTWVVAAETTWQFAGFDATPTATEVSFTLTSDGDRAAFVSAGGHQRRSPLWLTNRLEVRRTASTLVLAAAPAEETDNYARYARAAVPVVRRVLTDWDSGLVVEVPASVDGLHAALNATPEQYAAIAAVTTTPDGSTAPGTSAHVFVNPAVFGSLRAQGAQVVMSHEAAHVATDAVTTNVPLWLLEGFADYVALRDVRLPVSVTAAQIARQVREDGPPDHLPDQAEFDTRTTHLGAAYEAAWLACVTLAEEGSEGQLVRFYRQVASGTALAEALPAVFGMTEQELTRAWQARLEDLAA